MNIVINEELKTLIPALTNEEYATLEYSIINDGCRDALITWNNTLIDGHNRYEICTKHDIKYTTEPMGFADLNAVKIWMIDNQRGRRNLTDGWKFELMQIKKELLLKIGKESQGKRTDLLSTIDKRLEAPKHNTQSAIAKDLGWSTGKVAQADIVWQKATPEVKEQIKAGEVTFNQAYKEIKSTANLEVRKARVIEETKQALTIPAIIHTGDCMASISTALPIDLLITDPPYFTDGNFTPQISEWLKLVKPTGKAIVFSSSDPEEIAAYLSMDRHDMILEQMLIWNYNNACLIQPNARFCNNYQVAFYFRGSDAGDFNKPANGENQHACQTINAPDGRLGDRMYKWQKPIELIERYIRMLSKEGDYVVDPFAGSGTMLLAASKLGRKSWGCELDSEIVKIAVERGCNVI